MKTTFSQKRSFLKGMKECTVNPASLMVASSIFTHPMDVTGDYKTALMGSIFTSVLFKVLRRKTILNCKQYCRFSTNERANYISKKYSLHVILFLGI